jgi:hypothetical protein
MQNQPAGAAKKDFMAVLKETVTPAYSSRCWLSLFTKNVMANTPLCAHPPLHLSPRARNGNADGPKRYFRNLGIVPSELGEWKLARRQPGGLTACRGNRRRAFGCRFWFMFAADYYGRIASIREAAR